MSADTYLTVRPQAATGHDIPDYLSGRTRPVRLALLLMLSLVVGVVLGGVIMLQLKGWTSVAALAGGIAMVMKKKPARSALLAVGVPLGLLAGQGLFGVIHGTDLAVASTAPDDGSARLATIDAWADGGSLIRVGTDDAVSYDNRDCGRSAKFGSAPPGGAGAGRRFARAGRRPRHHPGPPLTIAFTLLHPRTVATLIGATTPAQIDALDAVELAERLTAGDVAGLRALATQPRPA